MRGLVGLIMTNLCGGNRRNENGSTIAEGEAVGKREGGERASVVRGTHCFRVITKEKQNEEEKHKYILAMNSILSYYS